MKKKFAAELLIVFAAVPLCVAAGSILFSDRRYFVFSLAIALLSILIFFLSFEKRERSAHRLVILSALTALSVAGRFIFAPVPFFKPVTAIVTICGMYLGCEAGFLCGALSAFLSNFLFMQGPWTPFQMFIWGLIGFIAGLLSKQLKDNAAILLLYGALSGITYSAFMDIWTTVWFDGTINLQRYLASVAAAVPITIIYVLSNIVFLLVLTKPIGRKLERIISKYGI